MKMDRRDLLKYFAAGTVIAPIAGAAPVARLIETPKVELVEATKIPTDIDFRQVKRFTVNFEMRDGSTRAMESGALFSASGVAKVEDSEIRISIFERSKSSPIVLMPSGWLTVQGKLRAGASARLFVK